MSNMLSSEEISRSHRWHALACNNLAWELSDLPDRTQSQDDEMLDAAHASAFHWSRVGTGLNRARAQMLLGHVYARLGFGRLALIYAKQSFDYIMAHEAPDWEIAFAYAILAHGAFAAGESDLHQLHYAKAKELGEAIAETEDREIFFKAYDLIPGPSGQDA